MKKLYFLILLLNTFFVVYGQDDFSWWNEVHGWEEGDPVWKDYLISSPGFLGPNALPVPEVTRGFLNEKTELEITASSHFLKGDPTQDISGRIFVPFANSRIAVEMYGVILEHYNYSQEVRDERFSHDKDGKGYAIGDLYFTTLIQLIKDRKFPNTLFRAGLKTASGELAAARYSDTPGYYFDLSFSKDFGQKEELLFRPFSMAGFYCWQTTDDYLLQNDALLYGVGIDFVRKDWRFTSSWSGYYGYKDNGDRPMQLNFELRKDDPKKAFRIQYQHGLHDWLYRTVRVSFIWKLNPVK